jgi:hypothetical protein
MQQNWTGSVPQVSPVRPTLPVQQVGGAADGHPTARAQDYDTVEVTGAGVPLHAYAKFIVHPDDNVVSVQIIDAKTDQVIRQIPHEEVLRIAEQLKAYMATKHQRVG